MLSFLILLFQFHFLFLTEVRCCTQNGELGNQVHTLSHHLSLPKTSSEMFAMDNLLQFPDSVPCKIRAKRGCATHPRSIAERVRYCLFYMPSNPVMCTPKISYQFYIVY